MGDDAIWDDGVGAGLVTGFVLAQPAAIAALIIATHILTGLICCNMDIDHMALSLNVSLLISMEGLQISF